MAGGALWFMRGLEGPHPTWSHLVHSSQTPRTLTRRLLSPRLSDRATFFKLCASGSSSAFLSPSPFCRELAHKGVTSKLVEQGRRTVACLPNPALCLFL